MKIDITLTESELKHCFDFKSLGPVNKAKFEKYFKSLCGVKYCNMYSKKVVVNTSRKEIVELLTTGFVPLLPKEPIYELKFELHID